MKKLTFSKKIAFIYSAILFSILMIFTAILYIDIRFNSKKEIETNLMSDATIIENFVKNNANVNQSNLKNLQLSNNIFFRIFNDKKDLFYSNGSVVPQFDLTAQNKVLYRKDPKNDEEFSYLNLKVTKSDRLYYIQVSQNIEYYERYNKLFEKALIVVSILGVFICLASGRYISKFMLKPIRNISNISREITSKNLDRRIPIVGPDDELKDLSSIFNSMFERLETDFEKQKRFTSDVSHELRTPLAVILGHITMLKRWGRDDSAVLSHSLDTLQSEVEKMDRLVDDLLFLSINESNSKTYKKENFNLAPLLQEVTDEAILVHPDYSVLYTCDKEYTINADYNAIKQVLRNLINNSIKYSVPPGDIKIKVERKKDDISIIVSDSGSGIPSECLPNIFDRFYRADESRNRATGGSGLGLSIAKNIVLNHNGNITAESKLGEGTKIIISLPWRKTK